MNYYNKFYTEYMEDRLADYMPQLQEFRGETFFIPGHLYERLMRHGYGSSKPKVLRFINRHNDFLIAPELSSELTLDAIFNGTRPVVWC